MIVTGGHGADAVDWLFDGETHMPIPVARYGDEATHGAGCTHSASLCAFLARGESLEDAARAAADVATEAVRAGLSEIGSGSGPVDVFGLAARASWVSSGSSRELERRGLAERIDADGAELGDGRVADAGRSRRGRSLPARMDVVARPRLQGRGGQPERPRGDGRRARGLFVVLAAPPETDVERLVELYEGLNEPGVPVRGGDTTAAPQLSVSVTALGRSERVPGRSGRSPAMCSS